MHLEAKKARRRYFELKTKEEKRHEHNLKVIHQNELFNFGKFLNFSNVFIEQNQREQFMKFNEAWDQYMSEYEEAAYHSLQQLNQQNRAEINDLRSRIVADYPIVGKPINKKIIEYKNKEKALTMLKRYDAAERVKRKRELLEETDMNNFIRQDIQKLIDREETKLRIKHDSALTALIKRIQRDRNEQLLHRQIDSKQLIQRNKNLIYGFIKRQSLEIK